jgi:ribonuclease P protein component
MLAVPKAVSAWLPDLSACASGSVDACSFQSPEMQRLKTRPQFQAALAGGTVSRTSHFALHRLTLVDPASALSVSTPSLGPALSPEQVLFGVFDVWLGAMVPKKWARRAVTRNTIKRQIYNVSAHFADALPCAAHVVRLRAGFDRKQFISATSDLLKAAVRSELEQLFDHAVATNPKPKTHAKPFVKALAP